MEAVRKVKVVASSEPKRKPKHARSLEERENQLYNLAYDLAEQQLLDGTASSQTINFFLKLGSSRERLEREILQKQKENIEAKTENIKSASTQEELYTRAIEAMSRYSGVSSDDEEYDDYEAYLYRDD